jgi:hypothetical protein
VNLLRSILSLAAILLASCASDSDSGTGTSTANAGYKPMSQRLNESNGYKVDSDGNWVPKSNKRSSYDGSGTPGGMKGNVGKKAYQAGKLQQKSWWGNKNYGQKQFGGNTTNTTFNKSSSLGNKGAREAGASPKTSQTYGTGTFASRAAGEGGGKNLPTQRFHNEGKRHQQPEIIDWKEQRSLSLEQSKGILGR